MKPNNNNNKKQNQNHMISELIQKYGPEPEKANIYNEFKNKGKLLNLIRTIFKYNRFDFDKYGYYLLNPSLLGYLLDLSAKQCSIYYIQWAALSDPNFRSNPIYMQCSKDITAITYDNQTKFTIWDIIYKAFYAAHMSNSCIGIITAITSLNSMLRYDGKPIMYSFE